MKDYFNTNKEAGPELIKRKKRAQSEQALTLSLLELHPYQSFTPPELHRLFKSFYKRKMLLNNMRRIMTNLTIAGILTKNDSKEEMRKGLYQSPNHTWVYIPEKRIAQQGNLF